MFSSTVLSLGLVLAPFANAAVHSIIVGGSQGVLQFHPEAIFAAPGDQVQFQFQQKNHTVTQSSFADPCSLKDGGFDSGFFPVGDDVTDHFPTYTIDVTDTAPIWVYCRQAARTPNSHCGKGMVFAVNCGPDGAENSFTNFKNSALAIGAQLEAAASTSVAASTSPAADPYGGGYGGGYGAPPVYPTETPAAASPTETPEASPTAVAGAAAATHTVTVGAGGKLAFEPANLKAQQNDVVVFQFYAKNHTVTQSSFASPCQPLAATASNGQVGFDSGFVPVAATATEFPTWSITINDTNPVWAYCKQGNHCTQGMVLAINSDDSSAKSYDAFKASAISGNSSSSGSNSPNPAETTNGAGRIGTSAGVILGAAAVIFAFVL